MAVTIESSGEASSSLRNPPDEEWLTRITRLQETLVGCPAGTSAGSELATLFEQLDKSEDALLNLSAILAFSPNSLKVREGVDRCRRQTGGPLQADR